MLYTPRVALVHVLAQVHRTTIRNSDRSSSRLPLAKPAPRASPPIELSLIEVNVMGSVDVSGDIEGAFDGDAIPRIELENGAGLDFRLKPEGTSIVQSTVVSRRRFRCPR